MQAEGQGLAPGRVRVGRKEVRGAEGDMPLDCP